jgi:hypothetical protein
VSLPAKQTSETKLSGDFLNVINWDMILSGGIGWVGAETSFDISSKNIWLLHCAFANVASDNSHEKMWFFFHSEHGYISVTRIIAFDCCQK